jgi:hypothetical protein
MTEALGREGAEVVARRRVLSDPRLDVRRRDFVRIELGERAKSVSRVSHRGACVLDEPLAPGDTFVEGRQSRGLKRLAPRCSSPRRRPFT